MDEEKAPLSIRDRITRLEERQSQNREDIARIYRVFTWLTTIVGSALVLALLGLILKGGLPPGVTPP